MTPTLSPREAFATAYRIERLLAQGGMGLVYVATHQPTGRRRALKVMSPAFLGSTVAHERFVLEATIGARIASEHVVEVTDAGVDEVGPRGVAREGGHDPVAKEHVAGALSAAPRLATRAPSPPPPSERRT